MPIDVYRHLSNIAHSCVSIAYRPLVQCPPLVQHRFMTVCPLLSCYLSIVRPLSVHCLFTTVCNAGWNKSPDAAAGARPAAHDGAPEADQRPERYISGAFDGTVATAARFTDGKLTGQHDSLSSLLDRGALQELSGRTHRLHKTADTWRFQCRIGRLYCAHCSGVIHCSAGVRRSCGRFFPRLYRWKISGKARMAPPCVTCEVCKDFGAGHGRI